MRTLPYLIYGLYVSRDPIALTLTNVLSSYTNEQFISIHNLPHHSFVFITHSLTQHLLTLLRFRDLCVRTYSNRTFFCWGDLSQIFYSFAWKYGESVWFLQCALEMNNLREHDQFYSEHPEQLKFINSSKSWGNFNAKIVKNIFYLRLQFTFNINSSSCTPVYCCSPSTLGALIIFKLVGNEEKVKATGDS